MMLVYAISDLHGYLPVIPDCDLLLLGGDHARNGHSKEWYTGTFSKWLKQVPARFIVGISGNHDFALQDKEFAKSLPWIYLQDELVDLEGIKIYGTPWSIEFGQWAFMADEIQLKEKYKNIPTGLDILLTHGPAYRHLDEAGGGTYKVHVGSFELWDKVKEVKPDSVISGHIHEARGIMEDEGIRFYNCTQMNLKYEPQYNIMKIDLRSE